MGAPFGRRHTGPRTAPQRRELALDLTADEVVLHEGNAAEGWRRFAGVALEDPVFLEMIGLLRSEAEEALGGARPVRLWLPAEQVLVTSMPIAETDPEARLAAAFDRIADTTGHDPDEVALAVAPARNGGKTTVLVAFAETLEEARDYAGRWGFRPGPVSTRHHAADFAPAEPVFRLRRAGDRAEAPARDRAPWAALGIAALAWVLAGAPAEAGAAPGTTPIPAARAGDSTSMAAAKAPAADAAQESVALAFLPPPRPGGTGPDPTTPGRTATDSAGTETAAANTAAGGATAPLPPVPSTPPDASRDATWTVAPSGPAADTGGLAGPLPPARPARATRDAPADRSAAPATLPAIGATAPPPVRAAAAERGLPLDSVALIGVLNLDSGREGLLRLPGGKFVTVAVGDVIEGWRVSAIGLDAMRVSRDGQDRTLLLVSR